MVTGHIYNVGTVGGELQQLRDDLVMLRRETGTAFHLLDVDNVTDQIQTFRLYCIEKIEQIGRPRRGRTEVDIRHEHRAVSYRHQHIPVQEKCYRMLKIVVILRDATVEER